MTDPLASRAAAHRPGRAGATVPVEVDPYSVAVPGSFPVGGLRLTRVHDEESLLDLLRRVSRAAVGSLG